MFSTANVAALALIAPLVSALTLTTPTNWTNADSAVVEWTTASGDPSTFDVELVNQAFNDQFALANNVDASQGTLTLNLPQVPVGDGYTLELTAVGNISDVFASTGDFAIGAQISSSTSSSSTSSGSSSASSSGSSSSASTTGASSSSAAGTATSVSSSSTVTSSSFSGAKADLLVSKSMLSGVAVMGAAALAGARLVGF